MGQAKYSEGLTNNKEPLGIASGRFCTGQRPLLPLKTTCNGLVTKTQPETRTPPSFPFLPVPLSFHFSLPSPFPLPPSLPFPYHPSLLSPPSPPLPSLWLWLPLSRFLWLGGYGSASGSRLLKVLWCFLS